MAMNSANARVADLFRAHYRPLSAYVKRRLRHGETEDLVQDAFLHFMRSGDPARLSQPRSYLFRIASNLIVDSQRKQRRREQHILEDVDIDNLSVAQGGHNGPAEAVMQASFVKMQLKELSQPCREVYVMYQIEGKTCHEIATHLAVSPRTVNRMMTRAVDQLSIAPCHP
jgi:RNA polymerase sigma factor (sigma-70 family)